MDEIKYKFRNKLIFGKYKITDIIGKGSFSTVYKSKNIINNKYFALKIQEKLYCEKLENETYLLFRLKGIGIPKVYSYGHSGKYYILVEELLGKTIDQLFKENKDKPNIIRLKDMLMVGIQILDRIRFIHSKNILHLDIKPNNFLVGDEDNSLIYIIDFGISKIFRSSRTGKHIKFSKKDYFSGNLLLSSVNTMKGNCPSRRDELESIGYLLIYLYSKHLPWDDIKYKNQNELAKKVLDIKSHLPIKMLCENVPKEMNEYMKYVKSLQFVEEPNYDYLSNIFRALLKKINKVNDFHFSWINESLLKKNDKTNYKFRTKRVSPFSKIIDRFRTKSANNEIIDKIDLNNKDKTISYHENNVFFKIKEQKEKQSNKILLERNKNSKQINIKCELGNKTEYLKRKTSNFKKKILNFEKSNLFKKINISKNNSLNKKSIINTSKYILAPNKIKNIQLNHKLLSRNNNLKHNFVIAPIISNKIINIYSNGFSKPNIYYMNHINMKKSQPFLTSNNNSLNNNNNDLYKRYYSFNHFKNDLSCIKYKRLVNKDNNEVEKRVNTISGLRNHQNFSCLNSDINYKRKFNRYNI